MHTPPKRSRPTWQISRGRDAGERQWLHLLKCPEVAYTSVSCVCTCARVHKADFPCLPLSFITIHHLRESVSCHWRRGRISHFNYGHGNWGSAGLGNLPAVSSEFAAGLTVKSKLHQCPAFLQAHLTACILKHVWVWFSLQSRLPNIALRLKRQGETCPTLCAAYLQTNWIE